MTGVVNRDVRGARVIGGKLKPNIMAASVVMPIVSVPMVNGRAVLRIDGSTEVPKGTVTGKYLTASGGFTSDPALATNVRGATGADSTTPGPQGNQGWSPVLVGEADGTRTLIKVADWTGGQGTKPATGMYLGTTGYVATKAAAFNFNAAKRVRFYQALTNAQGIATLNFAGEGFSAPPTIVTLQATATIGASPRMLIASVVAGSITNTQAQIKVEAQSLVTGVLTLLAGATATALVIET